jgi:hypothetical protein
MRIEADREALTSVLMSNECIEGEVSDSFNFWRFDECKRSDSLIGSKGKGLFQ